MAEILLGGEALAAGVVTRHGLRRWYEPLFRGVYIEKGVEPSLRDRAIGAWLATRRNGVVAGLAASALHGAPWVDPSEPIELVGVKSQPQDGLVARSERIAADEITRIGGLPVTSRVRTAFDLGRHLDRPEALARLDALMWNQRFQIADVLALSERYPRSRGVRQLRELLPLVDGGAASPKESRIRLLLLDAGFPVPETQIPVAQGSYAVAFLDMGWRDFQVAVEYDGDHHRKDRRQYVKDIGRLRMLESLGWIVIRVIAEDKATDVIARVEQALISRGCFIEINQLQRFTRTFAA
jgi:very-short-patch-repair endonuclease